MRFPPRWMALWVVLSAAVAGVAFAAAPDQPSVGSVTRQVLQPDPASDFVPAATGQKFAW